MRFVVDGSRCSGCGQCLNVCPQKAIRLMDGTASIDSKRCDACGACIDVCPMGAIRQLVPQSRATASKSSPSIPLRPAIHMADPFGRRPGRQYRRRRGWRH